MSKARNLAVATDIVALLNHATAIGHPENEGDNRRADADETAMLALQLEQFRTKVYEAEYPETKARQILPIASDISPGAEIFSWEERGDAGEFKQISEDGYADDPPSTEVVARKQSREIIELGGVVHYTLADMRRAAFTGRPLQSWKVEAMRRNAERKLDQVAALGATGPGGFAGIANQTVGTSNGQIRNTAMTSAAWDSTPDAAVMFSDLNTAVAAMVDVSKETQVPNTLILPLLQYQRLYNTMFTDGRPESVAVRFLATNPYITRIVSWDKFKSVDAGGNGSRGLLLNSDPDVLEVVIPQDFTVLPPQANNFAFKVLAHLRTAGTVIYRPLGLRYLTALPNT